VADDNLVDLEVDRIVDISWNTAAFESLVTDEGTKELILALVTNQLAAEKATDLIGGKGNGLIMLLHGYIPPSNNSKRVLTNKNSEAQAQARLSQQKV
jgi:hypothetical protein